MAHHPFLSRDTRTGIYIIRYYDRFGKPHSKSTGVRLKSEANKTFQNFRAHYGTTPLLGGFINEFLDTYALTHHSSETMRKHTKPALTRFHDFISKKAGQDVRLDMLTLRDIEAYAAERHKERAPGTVNVDLRMIRLLFMTAVRWDIIPKCPFNGMRFLKVPEKLKEQYMDEKQLAKLLKAIYQPWLKRAAALAFYTGMRLSEIRFVRWTDIDFEAGELTVRNSAEHSVKNYKERTIPLHPVMVNMLKEMAPVDEFVFAAIDKKTGKYRLRLATSWSHALSVAIERAKLPPTLHLHSLRHSFATNLIKRGAPLHEVQKLLGHADTPPPTAICT